MANEQTADRPDSKIPATPEALQVCWRPGVTVGDGGGRGG